MTEPRTERVFERSKRANYWLPPLTPFAKPHSVRGSQMTKLIHYDYFRLLTGPAGKIPYLALGAKEEYRGERSGPESKK
jgi:hypothetical protein